MSVGPGPFDFKSTREFMDLTQSIIWEYNLIETGYRLILNGGSYRTFPHLHIHLVVGDALPNLNE
jgi:diadenosine tetraphosphate (Ap4A) HIT family hydrolase